MLDVGLSRKVDHYPGVPSLPEIQIIVGSLGQLGPPCPASPIPGVVGPDGKLDSCYWWPGPTPSSYGGVYMGGGKMGEKYGIGI
jgi:hypothetical protein